MKIQTKIIFILISFLTPLVFSNEGVNSGGGGGVIACKSANSKSIKSHTYDLIEYNQKTISVSGKNYFININKSNSNWKRQLTEKLEIVKQLNSYQYDKIYKKDIEQIQINLERANIDNSSVIIRGDFQSITVPKQVCKENETAYYSNVFLYQDKPLNVTKFTDYYDSLSTETDKAAIELHEILYAILRNFKVKGVSESLHSSILKQIDSDSIRLATAVLFSDLTKEDKIEILSSNIHWLCSDYEKYRNDRRLSYTTEEDYIALNRSVNCSDYRKPLEQEFINVLEEDNFEKLNTLLSKKIIIKGSATSLNLDFKIYGQLFTNDYIYKKVIFNYAPIRNGYYYDIENTNTGYNFNIVASAILSGSKNILQQLTADQLLNSVGNIYFWKRRYSGNIKDDVNLQGSSFLNLAKKLAKESKKHAPEEYQKRLEIYEYLKTVYQKN